MSFLERASNCCRWLVQLPIVQTRVGRARQSCAEFRARESEREQACTSIVSVPVGTKKRALSSSSRTHFPQTPGRPNIGALLRPQAQATTGEGRAHWAWCATQARTARVRLRHRRRKACSPACRTNCDKVCFTCALVTWNGDSRVAEWGSAAYPRGRRAAVGPSCRRPPAARLMGRECARPLLHRQPAAG